MNDKDKFSVYIYQDNENIIKHIICSSDINLLAAMHEHQINIPSACGGSGYCGKCRIRLLQGTLAITPEDKSFFSEAELKQGWRLACKAYPPDSCAIQITGGDEGFEIITEHSQPFAIKRYQEPEISAKGLPEQDSFIKKEDKQRYSGTVVNDEKIYAIAIDIGTTTVVLSLININNGKTLWTYSAVNAQRAYGADVISRIQAAYSGKQFHMQELVRAQLLQGIHEALEKTKIDKGYISKIAIACNTTMGHILLGYSCEGLGRYPYTPVNISLIEQPFSQVFNSDYLEVPVVVIPGISTFIGGDIVAGLLSCDFDKVDRPSLLLDIGTNGEMALGNKERLLVSSSAAGPAFEGGNISCGVGSIAGAICSFDIGNNAKVSYNTIGNKLPVGICGTGIIELASELLKTGIIDDTGLLRDPYFDEGFLITTYSNTGFTFTQRDIRQLQMAKAAVRAGTDILISEYGITYDDIDKVFLAGGFGFRLNLTKAIHIGLLPQELQEKIIPVGNSALAGAINYLCDEDAPLRVALIIKAACELQLSEHAEFNRLYPEKMYFR